MQSSTITLRGQDHNRDFVVKFLYPLAHLNHNFKCLHLSIIKFKSKVNTDTCTQTTEIVYV